MNVIPARCQELASPNLLNFGVSCFLMFGILISYLPQHYKIIARRSSEGISPYFVLLGSTSGTCAIANILTLPTSREDMGCCRVISPFACGAGLLGIVQVGIIWSCFFLILLLFLIFVPRSDDVETGTGNKQWRTAVMVVCASVLAFIVIFIVSVMTLARFPSHLLTWANILGIACAVLTSVQYFPQIWTTYTLRHVGSLSVQTMMLQVPGSFIMAASLAVRVGLGGWSTWLVYVVSGSLQGCLLALALWFQAHQTLEERIEDSSLTPEERHPHHDLHAAEDTVSGHAESEVHEQTPLLGKPEEQAASYATTIWVGDENRRQKGTRAGPSGASDSGGDYSQPSSRHNGNDEDERKPL